MTIDPEETANSNPERILARRLAVELDGEALIAFRGGEDARRMVSTTLSTGIGDDEDR